MRNIVYITNISAPYRERFFEEFAKKCNLKVVYERYKSSNRDSSWVSNDKLMYQREYLQGINIGNENAFSLKILKYIFDKKNLIIIGCYNSPIQMFAILIMKLFRRPYILNIDGELFIKNNSIKSKIKKFFLNGADGYLVAGEHAAESLSEIIHDKRIEVYYFSSLNEDELNRNSNVDILERNKTVLIVGQYFDYKGMDIAVKVAKLDTSIKYKFVGMGVRTEIFTTEQNTNSVSNIEIVPYLSQTDLHNEYKGCSMLVLPSRQECWGLVINEAASFGMPIVSTWGSGAAIEFLSDEYPEFLAEPGNVEDLYRVIQKLFVYNNKFEYGNFLKNMSKNYSIEKSVEAHIKMCDSF